MNAAADLRAERFGLDLATIVLSKPAVLTSDLAVFKDLPAGGILLGSEGSTEPRLRLVATEFDRGAVVHVLESLDFERVIIARLHCRGEHGALAVKPGDLPWLEFARERLLTVEQGRPIDLGGCLLAGLPIHSRGQRPAHARRSLLWEDLRYGCLGDLAVQRLKVAA